jgi:HD superfamily phosphohydrolase YqeK
MVEEGRSYEGVEILRDLYEKDFEKCFREALKEEMIHLKNKGAPIYYLTKDAYEYYCK